MIKRTDPSFLRPVSNFGQHSAPRDTLDDFNLQRHNPGNPGASKQVTRLALPHLCTGNSSLLPRGSPALAKSRFPPAPLYDVCFKKRLEEIPKGLKDTPQCKRAISWKFCLFDFIFDLRRILLIVQGIYMYQGREWGEFLLESQVPTMWLTKPGSWRESSAKRWQEESGCVSGIWLGGGGAVGRGRRELHFSVHPSLCIARMLESLLVPATCLGSAPEFGSTKMSPRRV